MAGCDTWLIGKPSLVPYPIVTFTFTKSPSPMLSIIVRKDMLRFAGTWQVVPGRQLTFAFSLA